MKLYFIFKIVPGGAIEAVADEDNGRYSEGGAITRAEDFARKQPGKVFIVLPGYAEEKKSDGSVNKPPH